MNEVNSALKTAQEVNWYPNIRICQYDSDCGLTAEMVVQAVGVTFLLDTYELCCDHAQQVIHTFMGGRPGPQAPRARDENGIIQSGSMAKVQLGR